MTSLAVRYADHDAASRAAWTTACLAAALLAIAPRSLAGIVIDGGSIAIREKLADWMASALPDAASARRLPVGISDDRLMGGLDLAATLAARRPVAAAGLLAEMQGGVLVIPMAERLAMRTAAQVARVIDSGEVATEREGLSVRVPAAFVTVMLSDRGAEGEDPPEILTERLAFRVNLAATSERATAGGLWPVGDIAAARSRLPGVAVSDGLAEAMIAAGLALGVRSLRAAIFCRIAATAHAALQGRDEVTDTDAVAACQLVYGPRAVIAPQIDQPPESPPEPPDESTSDDRKNEQQSLDADTEMLVEAVQMQQALDMQRPDAARRQRSRKEAAPGKSGDLVASRRRGSPVSPRSGDPRRDGRLDVVATLRTAAPWQRLRGASGSGASIAIRASDFHVKRYRHRSESVVIFVVDASGSAAVNRLAEAKGAIELLLSSCYSRRESVALIAFRKDRAETLLPPTRSLTRVKRALAHLPGGGGTPLASAIFAATEMASLERRKQKRAHIVFLSDGQGNVALDGSGGRSRAGLDAQAMAARLKAAEHSVLFFDISKRPSPTAHQLSADMGAIYEPLPFADSRRVSGIVRERLLD